MPTSQGSHVTSRLMSIVRVDGAVCFQSSQLSQKHRQMFANLQVSLCCQNVSVEGYAEVIGPWGAPGTDNVRLRYRQVHPSSYDAYNDAMLHTTDGIAAGVH